MTGFVDLLLRLRPALPLLLLAIGAAVALLLLGLWWVLRRARRAPPEAAEEAPPASLLQLRRSFAEGVRRLRGYVPGRDFRYRIPWIVVLGEAGSGKTAAVVHAGVERPFLDPGEDAHGAKPACRWSFFDRGVVLDLDGDLVLRRDGATSNERGWRAFLRLLQAERPERPLDGVVLTIPATHLAGPEALGREALVTRGEAIFRKLWEAQRRLGIRFPVYVLVTRCDRLTGFRSVCAALPEALRDDVFGWSSPYPLESAFAPEWVDEAFKGMRRELHELQVDLLGGAPTVSDADGIFRFPGELARVREPLRLFLHEVFRESAYHEAFFFRGVYFTGDAAEEPREDASGAAPAPSPAFLRGLLEGKVLAERGLVRPARSAVRGRSRTVLAAQLLLLLVPLVGGAGLWWSYGRLARNTAELKDVLMEVEVDLARLDGPGADTAWLRTEPYDLLHNMSQAGNGPTWSLFMPTSLVGGPRAELRESMTIALDRVVLPAMRSALLARADSLRPRPGTEGPEALPRQLRAVRDLVENVERYNGLATRGAADVRALDSLTAYLYGKPLPPEPLLRRTLYYGFYTRALREAQGVPIGGDWTERAVGGTDAVVEEVYDLLSNRLAGLRTGSAGGAAAPGAVRAQIAGVRSFFRRSEGYWLDPEASPAALKPLLDSIPETRVLSGSRFRRDFGRRFGEIRAARLREIDADLELHAGESAPGRPGALPALRTALDSLEAQSFAGEDDPVPLLVSPSPGTRLAWDTLQLGAALAQERAYRDWSSTALQGLSPGTRSLVLGLATLQLEARMTRTVSAAGRPLPARAAYGQSGEEAGLAERVAAFQPAGDFLVQLVETFGRLGMQRPRDELAATAATQAAGMLGEVDRLLDGSGLYLPRGGGFEGWSGSGAPAAAAFGVDGPEGVEAYLAQQQARVRTLSDGYAAPLVGVLVALDSVSGGRRYTSSPTVARWLAIGAQLDAYDAKAPGSSLAALEQLVRAPLSEPGVGDCSRGGKGSAGSDFFAQRLVRLRTGFQARCRELAGADAVAGYDRLYDAFQQGLAGRYPFSSGSGGAEADPEAVRAFFRLYDASAQAREEIATGSAGAGGPGTPPARFLEQLAAVRTFLLPLLADSAAERRYLVGAEFRVDRAREAGGDQIAGWALEAGGVRLTPRADTVAGWRTGEPVQLSLRWASEAYVTPAPTPGVRVSGRTATFRQGGSWALLRLFDLRSSGLIPRARSTAAFRVRTVPAGGTAADSTREARVFVRLRVLDPATRDELAVPAFPTSAPPLRAARPARSRR